ncbi:ATP-binding cassette domain-containing protein [Winslowiella iniecta]|uniref:ABC transporter domain-containing protein n=1 Tax=Winslowiella iniecta TaxID=1560201 RepID=A0A0L7T7V9_9GAMM|nr:ATP-binding cassette domain-containing protein [Winslowiella iniecta]KOC91462.1 hypothetical protein NG43_15660 [Winslowiella iniecta]KOC92077.1 hypothetical protein NG42_02365 [Winslowiella iniecta]
MKSEQPLLAVNNLTHLWAPGKGFEHVSFELFPGEVLGIVGESGAGKTTLLQAISTRLKPQQGSILYQGNELYGLSESERRHLLRSEWSLAHQHPRLVFIDEPIDGLDMSVQSRLIELVRELDLAVVIASDDLAVVRLLAHRLLVMKQGRVVESGLTDRVLDDPHHPYTQLWVSSVLS